MDRLKMSVLTVVAISLTACAAVGPSQPGREADSQPTAAPTGQPIATSESDATLLLPISVSDALARSLGTVPEALEIEFAQQVEWLNSCLGLPPEGEQCAAVLTPGFGGLLAANGQRYEFRSDATGRTVHLIPGAVLAARQLLAQQLRFTHADGITIVRSEPVAWPDSCLGVSVEGMACAQGVVLGYRIVLEAYGDSFEFHTDQIGHRVVLAAAPGLGIDNVKIVWTSHTETSCQTAVIGSRDIAFGACGGPLTGSEELLVAMDRPRELSRLVEEYAPFQAETPAGTVVFNGAGATVANAAEQRMIAQWAGLVALEASYGRSGASWGFVVGWHREGAADMCDDVAVYITGVYYVTSCQGGDIRELGRGQLTADQLAQLYAWFDHLKPFERYGGGSDTGQVESVRLTFSGAGLVEATPTEQQAIQDFAAGLYMGFGR